MSTTLTHSSPSLQSRQHHRRPVFPKPHSYNPRTSRADQSVHKFNPKERPHDTQTRKVLRRLERRRRQSPPQGLHHRRRCQEARPSSETTKKPAVCAGTIEHAAQLFASLEAHNPNVPAALAALRASNGKQTPGQLTSHAVRAAAFTWSEFSPHTKSTYAKCFSRFLRYLAEVHHAPPYLERAVPKFHQPEARATIATDSERDLILAHTKGAFHFFLQLIADTGIRHQTASRMTPANFDPHTRSITFLTKGKVQQTLPVSARVADSFAALDPDADPQLPVIYQLSGRSPGRKPQRFSKQWTKLKAKLKLRPQLRIHDLRRTMAEDVWQATLDIRCVQAQLGHRSPTTTARYLANRIALKELQPIAALVEAIRAARTAKEQLNHHDNPGPIPLAPLSPPAATQPTRNPPTGAD